MLLHSVRFLCSVAAAFARLVCQLRKAVAMAVTARSPVISVRHAAAPVGLVASTPLSLRWNKNNPVAVQEPAALLAPPPPEPMMFVVPTPPCHVVAGGRDAEDKWQTDSSDHKKKKVAWAAKKRPSMLVIPVTDDADEVAAGWGAAAASEKDANVEVEGEGFCLASKAGPRHAMEDGYAVITDKNGGDDELVIFFLRKQYMSKCHFGYFTKHFLTVKLIH